MSFRSIADQLDGHSELQTRLSRSWPRVVVYERIAGGDGSTNWFVADTPELLQAVLRQLRPRSSVTFYFADRIRTDPHSPEVRERLTALLGGNHEVLVGRRGPRACDLTIAMISDQDALQELLDTIPRGAEVYWAGWPGQEDEDAISVALVDEDGSMPTEPVGAGS